MSGRTAAQVPRRPYGAGVEIPEGPARFAVERGLGTCTGLVPRRVTTLTVLAVFAPACSGLLLLTLSAAPPVVLALPVLIAGLLLHRRRDAGLYLFDGGVLVVSGWAAPRVVPWAEVDGRLAEAIGVDRLR